VGSTTRIILGTSIKTRLWLIANAASVQITAASRFQLSLETQSTFIFTFRPFRDITLLTISKQQKSIALLQIQIRKSSFELPPEEQGNQDSSVLLLKALSKIT